MFSFRLIHRLNPVVRHGSKSSAFSTGSSIPKIVFLGTPECAAKSLQLLHQHSIAGSHGNTVSGCCQYQISAVVTQPITSHSNRNKTHESPVHTLAKSMNLPVYSPESAKDPNFLETLKNLEPDLCITAAYGNFLPKSFLSIPKRGTVNIHPSLLPKYRGAAPIQRSLENGDNTTGVTVLYTVLKMDAGPIISQTKRDLKGSEKATELLDELFEEGTNQLLSKFSSLFNGSLASTPQVESEATQAPKVSMEEAQVDFHNMSASRIHNKVRAFAGWPGVWAKIQIETQEGDVKKVEERPLKLITTCVLGSEHVTNNKISFVKINGVDMLKIVCGDGSVLGVIELQPPNKKAMSAKAFLNGIRGVSCTFTYSSQ